MHEIFDFSKNSAHILRCRNCLARSDSYSSHFGIASIANIAAKIWKYRTKSKKQAPLQLLKVKHVPQGCPIFFSTFQYWYIVLFVIRYHISIFD